MQDTSSVPAFSSWRGPAVRIHHLDHACLTLSEALRWHRPITLLSARDAVASQGSAWFIALCRRAEAEAPAAPWQAVIDCDNAPGHALAALQAGAHGVLVRALHPRALERLRAIAGSTGQRVHTSCMPLLDLGPRSGPSDIRAALTSFLAQPFP